jgi:hypothetical protein
LAKIGEEKIGEIMDNKLTLWESLVAAHNNYIEQRKLFFKEEGYMDVIKSMLFPGERGLALELISILPAQKKAFFLKDIIHLGSFVHGFTEKCWELISDMPSEYVAKNIEKEVDEMLLVYKDDNVYEVYRCLLTFCDRLGYSELVQKIALRALNSSDNDVKEAGMDFIKRDAD